MIYFNAVILLFRPDRVGSGQNIFINDGLDRVGSGPVFYGSGQVKKN